MKLTPEEEPLRFEDIRDRRMIARTQTLQEAVLLRAHGSWPCACSGVPNCCMNFWPIVDAQVHAASVIARQLRDLAEKKQKSG